MSSTATDVSNSALMINVVPAHLQLIFKTLQVLSSPGRQKIKIYSYSLGVLLETAAF